MVDERVSLVRDHGHGHGLNQCCEALALSRRTWRFRKQRDDSVDVDAELLKTRLRKVIRERPVMGTGHLKNRVLGCIEAENRSMESPFESLPHPLRVPFADLT